ncbi:hypothetical protein [Flavobacterium sp. GT3R68]|uniref:hypothetical protein n=1 Tax=Flavobacterium sp. GT3R68 TaxID=2594437 RepID=UPI000F86107A|nr:hypothetical protein [Flavobacterium sp. GT3R68]RTY89820.1 hypothetical protein EKL32_21945 [Flavobacterium sp. GSN2]TRW89799.1 hypothetical protein FNW07_12175 [Flavobacterium sp. GT3R68]
MKKIYRFLSFLVLAFLFIQCTGEETTSGDTMFVNDVAFPIGANGGIGSFYNSTMFHAGTSTGDYNIRTFTIVKANSTSEEDADTINLSIFYPVSQSIDGTYNLDFNSSALPSTYAVCVFANSAETFGDGENAATGTVTITDNGNNNFKIVFNNVVLTKEATGGSKTITGYCAPTFMQF